MKFRIVLSVSTVIAMIFIGMTPNILLSSIPQSTVIIPKSGYYQKNISVNGTIQSLNSREVYLEAPVIADSIEVSIGDYVEKNQVIAIIDTNMTKTVLSNSIDITGNFDGSSNFGDLSDIARIAREYGFSDADIESVLGLDRETGVTSVYENTEVINTVPSAILAPIDGIITEINIKSGVLTQTNRPVVTITDDDSYMVIAPVSEIYITQINVGDKVRITGPALKNVYEGIVTTIYPTAKRIRSGSSYQTTVDVEIDILNPDNDIKPGYTASAQILVEKEKLVFMLPYEAIRQDDSNREYVYIYENGIAKKRYILTGDEFYDGVEVLEGINENELVLMSPDSVKEGGRVRIMKS